MGLLDDAIREHLDLKRRRGADPAEIERLEREALGPVRRDPIGMSDPGPVALAPEDPLHEDVEDFEHSRHDLDAEDLEPDFPPEPDFLPESELPADPPPAEAPRRPRLGFLRRGQRDPEPRTESDELFDHVDDLAAEPPPQVGSLNPVAEPPAPPSDFNFHEEPVGDDASRPLGPPEPQETVEYDVEGAFEEDPLEETPDFLQDTPDHDRLWFEQKPPRDFDL